MHPRVAIIGAGIAGLSCAAELSAHNVCVSLFDKSRGAGGRICTRRVDVKRYDHGAQYFTTSDTHFRAAVDSWSKAGIVETWNGRFGRWQNGALIEDDDTRKRWVGAPRMSMIGRHLAAGLNVHTAHRVNALRRDEDQWVLEFDKDCSSSFDWVFMSCPGPQAAQLLRPHNSILTAHAEALSYGPCWALMLSFPKRVDFDFDGVKLIDHAIGWMCRDSSKPGRDPGERWVIHGSPEWSETHLEHSPEAVQMLLIDALGEFIEAAPTVDSVHRWRYALAQVNDGQSARLDPARRLGLFGDALAGPRVEAAWLSGRSMAARFLEEINRGM